MVRQGQRGTDVDFGRPSAVSVERPSSESAGCSRVPRPWLHCGVGASQRMAHKEEPQPPWGMYRYALCTLHNGHPTGRGGEKSSRADGHGQVEDGRAQVSQTSLCILLGWQEVRRRFVGVRRGPCGIVGASARGWARRWMGKPRQSGPFPLHPLASALQ